MSKEAPTKKKNGKQAKSPRKRRRAAVPQLTEKTKKLILKAFRKTYEAHHAKSS